MKFTIFRENNMFICKKWLFSNKRILINYYILLDNNLIIFNNNNIFNFILIYIYIIYLYQPRLGGPSGD